MKRKNRILSLVMVLGIIISSLYGNVVISSAAGTATATKAVVLPTDLKGHWAQPQITNWVEKGFVSKLMINTKNKILPDMAITRAEFISLVNASLGFVEKAKINFKDVSTKSWYYDDVAKAVAVGYISGYNDGTMKPDAKISRQEMAVILTKVMAISANVKSDITNDLNSFSDVKKVGEWAKISVASLVKAGYMKGYADKSIKPLNSITRAEAITLLDRAVGTLYNTAGNVGSSSGVKTVTGNVTVSVPGIVVKNLNIKGNIYLTEGIGNGEVTLENVTVSGNTLIRGGGSNSIIIKNSTLASTIVEKKNGSVRVEATGNTSIGEVSVKSGSKLEEKNVTGEGFSKVTVDVNTPSSNPVQFAGNFSQVNISSDKTKVEVIKGIVGSLKVEEATANVNVTVAGGTVEELNLKSKAEVNVASGKVNELEIEKGAAGTTVELGKAAQVGILTAEAKVDVSGQGQIHTAEINVAGVTIDQTPLNIIVEEGVTAKVGDKAVDKTIITVATITPRPTNTPEPMVTPAATVAAAATKAPTAAPTAVPTAVPTVAPTAVATAVPTATATTAPSVYNPPASSAPAATSTPTAAATATATTAPTSTSTSTAAPSNDATLKASSIVKGQAVTGLGTPNAAIGSVVAGTVTITAAKAADTTNLTTFITLFDPTDAGASVTRVVKYASAGVTTGFATDAVYANEAITDGDFFIIQVTAADSSVLYYKITVTVTPAPSNDATLKASSIVKGQAVTGLGTPNATIGSVVAGTVTITAAKAADTTNLTTFITLFDPTDAGASVTRVVKYASAGVTTGFATDAVYANEAITDGDFFIIQVTAADSSVLYYKITVTVTPAPSNDATLKASSTVKGQAVTGLGTPNAAIGSVVAGTVTITAAKAADTTNLTTFITLFDPTDAGASVTRVVKYASAGVTTGFATDAVYANEAITDGDFFIIQVTAADSSVLYYKITITVTPAPSNDATLKASSTVKGQAVTGLGTPNATLDSVVAGTVTITAAKAADTTNLTTFITLFDPTDAGASVTRVVKYASAGVTTGFATDAVYANEAITDGDFFIIQVTAADSSVLYYKITVTVTPAPSNDATLNASSTVKGQTVADLGTPNATLDSVVAGTVTITAAEAADTTNLTTFITLFDPTDAGASVTRVVKYASAGITTGFATDAVYANEAITDDDFFIIQVTAADSSVLYYNITVTVTP